MSEAKISFLRHKSGNGKLFNNSEAITSFIDRQTSVFGTSSVFDSQLRECEVHDSTISFSRLSNCIVRNSTLVTVDAENSLFNCEFVSAQPKIINSCVLEKSRVIGHASLNNVRFKALTVFGLAELTNWPEDIFDGQNGYIGFGRWIRPPQVIRINDLTVTESIPGFAFVGCYHRPIKEWLKFGERIGITFGVSLDDVSKIRAFLHTLS